MELTGNLKWLQQGRDGAIISIATGERNKIEIQAQLDDPACEAFHSMLKLLLDKNQNIINNANAVLEMVERCEELVIQGHCVEATEIIAKFALKFP